MKKYFIFLILAFLLLSLASAGNCFYVCRGVGEDYVDCWGGYSSGDPGVIMYTNNFNAQTDFVTNWYSSVLCTEGPEPVGKYTPNGESCSYKIFGCNLSQNKDPEKCKPFPDGVNDISKCDKCPKTGIARCAGYDFCYGITDPGACESTYTFTSWSDASAVRCRWYINPNTAHEGQCSSWHYFSFDDFPDSGWNYDYCKECNDDDSPEQIFEDCNSRKISPFQGYDPWEPGLCRGIVDSYFTLGPEQTWDCEKGKCVKVNINNPWKCTDKQSCIVEKGPVPPCQEWDCVQGDCKIKNLTEGEHEPCSGSVNGKPCKNYTCNGNGRCIVERQHLPECAGKVFFYAERELNNPLLYPLTIYFYDKDGNPKNDPINIGGLALYLNYRSKTEQDLLDIKFNITEPDSKYVVFSPGAGLYLVSGYVSIEDANSGDARIVKKKVNFSCYAGINQGDKWRCWYNFDNEEMEKIGRGKIQAVVEVDDYTLYSDDLFLIERNLKKEIKDRALFVVSDADWKKVLSGVPAVLWSNSKDSEWCQKVSSGKCGFPFIVYNKEGQIDGSYFRDNSEVKDPLFSFIDDYKPTTIYTIGSDSITPSLNAGGEIIKSDWPDVWKEKGIFIIGSEKYKEGIISSQFASSLNAPILFGDAGPVEKRVVIATGSAKSEEFAGKNLVVTYNETTGIFEYHEGVIKTNFNFEKVQNYLISKVTGYTGPVIFTNPYDTRFDYCEKNNNSYNTYCKQSLLAPFYAAGMNYKIAFLDSGGYFPVGKDDFKDAFKKNDLKRITLYHNWTEEFRKGMAAQIKIYRSSFNMIFASQKAVPRINVDITKIRDCCDLKDNIVYLDIGYFHSKDETGLEWYCDFSRVYSEYLSGTSAYVVRSLFQINATCDDFKVNYTVSGDKVQINKPEEVKYLIDLYEQEFNLESTWYWKQVPATIGTPLFTQVTPMQLERYYASNEPTKMFEYNDATPQGSFSKECNKISCSLKRYNELDDNQQKALIGEYYNTMTRLKYGVLSGMEAEATLKSILDPSFNRASYFNAYAEGVGKYMPEITKRAEQIKASTAKTKSLDELSKEAVLALREVVALNQKRIEFIGTNYLGEGIYNFNNLKEEADLCCINGKEGVDKHPQLWQFRFDKDGKIAYPDCCSIAARLASFEAGNEFKLLEFKHPYLTPKSVFINNLPLDWFTTSPSKMWLAMLTGGQEIVKTALKKQFEANLNSLTKEEGYEGDLPSIHRAVFAIHEPTWDFSRSGDHVTVALAKSPPAPKFQELFAYKTGFDLRNAWFHSSINPKESNIAIMLEADNYLGIADERRGEVKSIKATDAFMIHAGINLAIVVATFGFGTGVISVNQAIAYLAGGRLLVGGMSMLSAVTTSTYWLFTSWSSAASTCNEAMDLRLTPVGTKAFGQSIGSVKGEDYGKCVIAYSLATMDTILVGSANLLTNEGTLLNALRKFPPKTAAGGCFLADTPIMMADGSYKNIQDINKGDKVKAWDLEKNKPVDSEVSNTFVRPENKYLEIEYETVN